MSLLGRTWGLHDVEDVEKLVSKALDDSLRKRNAFLRPHEREDAIAYLLSVVWALSETWDAERAPSFATFAYRTLRLRVVDFYRQEYGRTRWEWKDSVYERERPIVFSIERDTGTGGESPRHHNAGAEERVTGELARAYAERSSDPANGCDPDLSRLLTGGSSQRARDLDELGLGPPGRAAA